MADDEFTLYDLRVEVVDGGGDYLEHTLRLAELRLDAEDRERLDAVLRHHSGPAGDVYSVEREVGGRHAVIMRTGLNADQ